MLKVIELDLLVHTGRGGRMRVARKGDSSWERQLITGWKLCWIY